jgi:formylglycine-generating enzyme required for sulfatase activity
VDCVTWGQAAEFCTRISGRLPSEAEWEFAAAAGETAAFPCGDASNCLETVAWYATNSASGKRPVASKDASRVGLYDMSGNVAEWVADAWHPDYQAAPGEGWPAWDAKGTAERAVRGGSFYDMPVYLRTTKRQGGIAPDTREPSVGFRCAHAPSTQNM